MSAWVIAVSGAVASWALLALLYWGTWRILWLNRRRDRWI